MGYIKHSTSQRWSDLKRQGREMNERNDCSVIALAAVCDVTYKEAHEALEATGRKNRQGTTRWQAEKAIHALGCKIVRVWVRYEVYDGGSPIEALQNIPVAGGYRARLASLGDIVKSYPGNHKNLQSVTSHHPRRFPKAWEFANGKQFYAFSREHALAIVDGEVQDWSRNNALRLVGMYEVEKA